MRQVAADDPGMNSDQIPADHLPGTTPVAPSGGAGIRRAGLVAIAAVAVGLALTGCGARAGRRDATPTTSTTVPATVTSTTVGTASTVQTDDIEQDLDTVQSDLNGAAQDLRDGPTEATTDTRG
jgi:hypothetical protein